MRLSKSSIIIIALAACFLIGIITFFTLSASLEKPQSVVAPKDDVAPATTAPKEPINNNSGNGLQNTIEKDSVLISGDGGLTFAPDFKISSNSKMGQADVLSIAFHPLKKGFVVVSSIADGLFRREGEEITWSPIAFPPKKIYSFIVDKNDPDKRFFASGVTDKNGRVFRTSDGGTNWRAVYAEPGDNTAVTGLAQHPRKKNIIFAGTSVGTIVKSLDGGDTWKNVGTTIKGSLKDFSFDSTNNLVTYVLADGAKMYYSKDGGDNWIDWEVEKAKEVADLNKASSESAKNGDKVQAEKLRGEARALSLRNTKNKMPPGISTIVADPRIPGVVYAGTNAGLFRSTTYGKYWDEVNIIESALRFKIRSLAVNPTNSKEIIFVAGKSFYKSMNNGDTWSVTPLPSTRNASFIVYDPLDTTNIFIGVSSI